MRSFDITPRINVAVSRATMSLRDRQLHKRQKGLTTVEYAVAGALIAVVVVAAFTALGEEVANTIWEITGVLNEDNTPQ